MSPPPIPRITHMQFVVLGALRGADRRGRHLRRELGRHGVERSAPAFYQMMARLEDAGLVDGEYDQKIVAGQIIKERRYRLTAAGAAEWTRTRDFYAERIGSPALGAAPQRRKGPARA